MANYVTYTNAQAILTKIGKKFEELGGAYVAKGSKTFAEIPATPSTAQLGYVFNITEDFTTDARFIEGAGKKYPAGTNIVVIDASTIEYTEVTPDGSENPSEEWYEENGGVYTISTDTTVDSGKTYYKKVVTLVYMYDVLGNFIDVDKIETEIDATQDMISDDFDATKNYAIGDIVKKDDVLYKFTSDYMGYTAVNLETLGADQNDPSAEGWFEKVGANYVASTDTTIDTGKTYYKANEWNSAAAERVTVADLIDKAEPEELTEDQLNDLLGILD